MTIMSSYEAAIASGDIEDDPKQRQIIIIMDDLAKTVGHPRKFFLNWRRPRAVKGLYLFGPVGTGKTYLMDLFYEQLDTRRKVRFHFHQFMQQIDLQLRLLQGHKNPLQIIAANLAKTTHLLCFDEFLVQDMAHAMILAELLKALFANGIILVATSNTRPDDLYANGVQRARFLPAIALIKAECTVLELTNKRDYRLGRASKMETWLFPLNEVTTTCFTSQFIALEPENESLGWLSIQNREIPFIKCGKRAVWFDFKVICNMPRSQLDYLEIADRFATLFISDIPILGENDIVFTILFVHLIDVTYDRGIRLVVSAQVPLAQLYRGGEMSDDFKRAASRLEEMQSDDYLRRHERRTVQSLSNL